MRVTLHLSKQSLPCHATAAPRPWTLPRTSSPLPRGGTWAVAPADHGQSRPTLNDHVRREPCQGHGHTGSLRQRASASGSGRGSSSRSRVKVRPSARWMGSLPVPYLWVCAAM